MLNWVHLGAEVGYRFSLITAAISGLLYEIISFKPQQVIGSLYISIVENNFFNLEVAPLYISASLYISYITL